MIQGIDISHHQGAVDFAQVAASGMRFCVVKATEGEGYVDPRFVSNWEALQQLGDDKLYRGAYHFARPDSVGTVQDAINEATDFCDALLAVGGFEKGCLPPALDFEKYSDNGGRENVPWIEAFVATVEDKLGRSPMIYTGANVWRYETGNSDAFVHLPLWQVYYSETATHPPEMPWPFHTFWQWSGGGDFAFADPVPGVGTVDVNRFSGSAEDLARLAMMDDGCDKPPQFDKLLKLITSAEGDIADGLTKIHVIRRKLESL